MHVHSCDSVKEIASYSSNHFPSLGHIGEASSDPGNDFGQWDEHGGTYAMSRLGLLKPSWAPLHSLFPYLLVGRRRLWTPRRGQSHRCKGPGSQNVNESPPYQRCSMDLTEEEINLYYVEPLLSLLPHLVLPLLIQIHFPCWYCGGNISLKSVIMYSHEWLNNRVMFWEMHH